MSGQSFEAQMEQIAAVEDAHAAVDAHRTHLKADYEEGLILFHKDRLRSLKEQVDAYKRTRTEGTMLHLQDVWGDHVELPIMTGKLYPLTEEDEEDNCERVMGDPIIGYHTFQELLNLPKVAHNPFSAVLPLYVTYEEIRRRSQTLQLIVERGPPSPSALELGHELGAVRQGFEVTSQRDHLGRLFQEKRRQLGKVRKIVAFACGSMVMSQEAEGNTAMRDRALTQHVLLLCLRQLLSELHPGRDVPCFVQDPAYSGSDKQLLTSLGMTVVANPDGLFEVDDTTLVFSIAAGIPVKQVVTDFARPAAIIWDNLKSEELLDPWSPRVDEMVSWEYENVDLIWHQHYNYATLLLRSSEEDDAGEEDTVTGGLIEGHDSLLPA